MRKPRLNGFSKYFFWLVGLLFMILGILAVVESFANNNPLQILWLCYLGLFLTGVGIFRRSTFLLISQLNILMIPVIIWGIDFFYVVFFNKSLFGITDYFFQGEKIFISVFINSQHLFIVPLSLLAIYFIGVKRKDMWKWSMIQLAVFFVIIRVFTPVDMNINYSFQPFSLIDFVPLKYYGFLWFVLLFVMVYVSNWILVRLGQLRMKNK